MESDPLAMCTRAQLVSVRVPVELQLQLSSKLEIVFRTKWVALLLRFEMLELGWACLSILSSRSLDSTKKEAMGSEPNRSWEWRKSRLEEASVERRWVYFSMQSWNFVVLNFEIMTLILNDFDFSFSSVVWFRAFHSGSKWVFDQSLATNIRMIILTSFPLFSFLCPVDARLVDFSLLSSSEVAWLKEHNESVKKSVLPLVKDDKLATRWLKRQ